MITEVVMIWLTMKRYGMNKKVKKDIFIGIMLLAGYLLIHRVVSDKMIEDETDK